LFKTNFVYTQEYGISIVPAECLSRCLNDLDVQEFSSSKNLLLVTGREWLFSRVCNKLHFTPRYVPR